MIYLASYSSSSSFTELRMCIPRHPQFQVKREFRI
ncbi:hypothetical protein LINGRAPRIM_LOCUS2543 [Linum grandiflorum]